MILLFLAFFAALREMAFLAVRRCSQRLCASAGDDLDSTTVKVVLLQLRSLGYVALTFLYIFAFLAPSREMRFLVVRLSEEWTQVVGHNVFRHVVGFDNA